MKQNRKLCQIRTDNQARKSTEIQAVVAYLSHMNSAHGATIKWRTTREMLWAVEELCCSLVSRLVFNARTKLSDNTNQSCIPSFMRLWITTDSRSPHSTGWELCSAEAYKTGCENELYRAQGWDESWQQRHTSTINSHGLENSKLHWTVNAGAPQRRNTASEETQESKRPQKSEA